MAKVFNLCKTVNYIAVYGITMSRAGTFPRQKPGNNQISTRTCKIKEVKCMFLQEVIGKIDIKF